MQSYDHPEIDLSEILKEILDLPSQEFAEVLEEAAQTHMNGETPDRLSFYDYATIQTSMWRDIAGYERRHALLDMSLETSNSAESGRYIGLSIQGSHDMIVRAKLERVNKIGPFEAASVLNSEVG